MSGTANVQAAYPGKPGAGWQDDEGACWVLCADGKMRLLVETEEPEDPAELDARFGPMLPLDSNQQPADVVTAEQQQDEAVGRVEAFLDDWPNGDVVWFATAEDVAPLTTADLRTVLAERTALAAPAAELTAGQDMCTCNEPRKVCELRTELDRVHAQLNAALAERPEES